MTQPIEDSDVQRAAVSASRRKFIALVLIAFVPIFIASGLFFFFPDSIPKGTTNQGELISPPIAANKIAEELGAMESWVLLVPVVAQSCDVDCTETLYLTRQIVAGLGKERTRVQRAVLMQGSPDEAFTELLEKEHSDIKLIEGSMPADQTGPVLFLKDPNGNVMMHYTKEKLGAPLRKDLKHLLRVSNIG